MRKKYRKAPFNKRPPHADPPYIEDLFMDSGAWGLFTRYVLKKSGKQEDIIGKHGKILEPTIAAVQDYSFYDLSKGSKFRSFCDRYASFIKKMAGKIELFANMDVIGNAEMTWQVQQYFEQEHGLRPIPVIHHGASLKYVDRYIEKGYDLIGLGGMAGVMKRAEKIKWCDDVFIHLCPKSNNYLPIVRTHGFAITDWHLLFRWPWWSVDSASWIKYAAFGWVVLPRLTKGEFDYTIRPNVVNCSTKSVFKHSSKRHMNNVPLGMKETLAKWAEHTGVPIGITADDGTVIEKGFTNYHQCRNKINTIYYMEAIEHIPPYPWPLDPKIVNKHRQAYWKGFGL
jgi:hypothetical protein